MTEYQQYAQAGVAILAVYTAVSQAEVHILAETQVYSQAQVHILVLEVKVYSQAEVVLNRGWGIGQSQSGIITLNNNQYAQAAVCASFPRVTTVYLDTFSRADTTAPPFNLGSPDIGPAWIWTNDDSSYTEATSPTHVENGVLTGPIGSSKYDSMQGPPSITTGEFYMDFWLPASGDNTLRFYYYDTVWYFQIRPYETYITVSGYNTSYNVTPITRSSWYRIHASVNTSISEKVKIAVWKIGDSEPFQTTIQTSAASGYNRYLDIYYSPTNETAKFDNFRIEAVGNFIYNQSYGAALAQIRATYWGSAQVGAILNQSLYVAQSLASVKTTYQKYSQAQAFIRKSRGHGQAQTRIAYPSTDAYGLMVKEDGATHLYGMHLSNAYQNSEYLKWLDEIGLSDTYTTNAAYNSREITSPVGPEYNGIYFNSYTEYIQFNSNLPELSTPTAGIGTWTVETWVLSPPAINQKGYIFEVYGGLSGTYRVANLSFGSPTAAASTGNYIRLYITDTAGTTVYSTGIEYATSTWYHVAVAYINGYFKVYINGQLISEIARATWSTVTTVNNLYLNYSYNGGYSSTTSRVAYDNLAIYPFEVTQNILAEHYNYANVIYRSSSHASVGFWIENRSPGAKNIWQQFGNASYWIEDLTPGAVNHRQTFHQAQAHITVTTPQYAQSTVRITDAKDQNVYASAQTVIIPMQGLLRYFIQGTSTNYLLPDQGTYSQITSMTAVTDPAQIAEVVDQGSYYGIRWQSWFVADMSGDWWFQTQSDDGSGVFIYDEQNQLVGSMDNQYGTGLNNVTKSGIIPLVAGTRYKIDVKYSENTGSTARIYVWYKRPGGTDAMLLLAGAAPWNNKSYLPTVRYWGMGLANALWVERNDISGAYVWPNYAQAQTKIWYPGQQGYGQATVQIGGFQYAQAITQIAYEVPDTYRTAVLADKPILYYPMDEVEASLEEPPMLHTIIGRRDGVWNALGATLNGPSAIGTGSSIDFNGYIAPVSTPPYGEMTTEALTFPGTSISSISGWKVSNQFWMNAGDTVTINLTNAYNSGNNISLGIYKLSDGITADNQYAFIGVGPVSGTYTRTAAQTGIYFVYIWPNSGTPTGSGTVSYPSYGLGDSAIPITDGSCVTVETWIKPDGSGGDPRMIFGFTHNYVGAWADGKIGFGDGSGHYYATAAGTLVTNTWYHIAAVFYSGQACSVANKIYINGALQTLTATGVNVTRYAAQNFVIGGWNSNTSYRWTAPMDEMSIFNYELTNEQVLTHYRAYKKQVYAQANVWAIGHPTAHGQALWFTGRQPDGIYHELKNYGQTLAQILVHDNNSVAQAGALIQSPYGLTRMTWNNAAYVVGNIYSWDAVEGITLGNPNYSSSGVLPNPYPGSSNWGMAWSGNFVADVTGTWQFRTTSDDGSDLWISGTRVVDNGFGTGHSTVTATGTINLVEGNFYTIHARFGQGGGPWNISIQYKRPADVDWYYLTDNAPPWIRQYWHGGFAQATAEILPTPNFKVYAQAQAKLNSFNYPQRAQAQADILQVYRVYAQALAHVGWLRLAQAQARIIAFGVTKYASTKAHIKVYGVSRHGIATVATIRAVFNLAQAAVSIKQTYPFRYINPNYSLTSLGTTVTPEPNFSLEGTVPENVLDGDIHSVWTNFLAIDANEDIYFYLNLDLGTARTISSYYILPVDYNVTANLQYSSNGLSWADVVTNIYFDVNTTSPTTYADVIAGEITPIHARYWRLKFINGGDDNKVSIATFQLGIATTQNPTFGQAQAFFGHFGVAQALAYIAPGLSTNWAQAKAQIRQTYSASANAQFWYLPPTVAGQAQALIVQVYQVHGLAMAWALPPTVFGFAQVHIITTYQGQGQALTGVKATYGKYGAARVNITKCAGHAHATALIIRRSNTSGYAMVYIGHFVHGLASVFIVKNKAQAQAQALIKQDYSKYSQALVLMRRSEVYSQSRTAIKRTYSVHAQCQTILNQHFRMAQARVACVRTYNPVANVIYTIKARVSQCSQAQVVVRRRYPYNYGHSRVLISRRSIFCGLAMTQIGAFKYAQAQAQIIAFNVPKTGLAAGYILVDINVPAPYPTSNLQSYLIMYNNQTLPGYAQSEFLTSVARLSTHKGAYNDTSVTDYLGLENKEIALKMLVWEPTYLECKIRVQEAATILRSKRKAYNKLYIQQYDKYYQAMPKAITTSKSLTTGSKTLEYEITFDAKPWLVSNEIYTFTGTDSINIEDRTLLDGGWTPTLVIVSGTDITISGVTEYGEDTGSITISGTVSNYVIDSENFETSDNTLITPTDYGLYVGPGKTYFTITGATSCRIEYHNRWYI